ncbi:MAG: VWA-like domain-containing protein [Bacteroidota bacterium]
MRRVRCHWPLAYSKLLAMRWEETNATPYGATDGIKLVLNPDGLDRISKTSDPVGFCAFLLVHEALHAMLSHGARLAKFTDRDAANRAADYIINAMIVHRNKQVFAKVPMIPFPLIPNVLFDEALSGDKSVEQLYDELFKSPEPDKQPQSGQQDDPQDQSDDPQDQSVDQSDDADDAGDAGGSDSGDADDDDQPTNGDSSDSSPIDGKSDSEILGQDWVGGGAEDTFKPEADPSNGKSEDDVAREIEDQNEQIILGEQLNHKAGLVGATDTRKIEQLRSFREGMDWADYLKQWFTARCQSGWDKPFNAPIFTTTGLVSAGRQKKDINELAVVIDTSCSVPQEILREMLEAVQDALDTLRPDTIYLLSVDHKVEEVIELRHGDQVPTSIKGGGGTLFKPAFDWIEENASHIDGLVYLTDGEAYDWIELQEPPYPVLWLDYGRHPEVYKFGERVKVSAR